MFASIQAAINAASNGTTVLVDEGTYPVHLRIPKRIVLASRYILDGDTAHISRTILDGSGASHADSGSVVLFDAGTDTTTVLCGFTITRGRGTLIPWTVPAHYGAGIMIEPRAGGKVCHNIITGNTSVAPSGGYGGAAGICVNNGYLLIRPHPAIIEDNIIENNIVTPTDASSGTEVAGIGFWGGNGRICRNIIRNNRVFWASTSTSNILGGGVLIGTDASMEMRVLFSDNLLDGNRTYRGGGLAVYGSATIATVQRNIFVNNTADFLGGGMCLFPGATNTIVSGNYFARNTSARGGGIGIWNSGSNAIVNNIIVNNTSTLNSGAGIYVYESVDVRLVNNTVAFNQGGSAHALFIGEATTGLTPCKVLNNIFWGASAPSIAMTNTSYHLVRSCIVGGGWSPGTTIYNTNPLFVEGDTLYRPSETAGRMSPVFGKGELSATMGGFIVNAPATDYFGAARPRTPESNPDLGAIESDRIDHVEELAMPVPQSFSLSQNFPNPFNPATTIRFSLPRESSVRVVIRNILGQNIEELVNERMSAGVKQVTWTARVPSGVYLYTLEAVDGSGQRYSETKRMLLLK